MMRAAVNGRLDYDSIRRRRAVIEEALRAELQAARAAFTEVKEQYRHAIALVEDLGPNSPDGHHALRELVKEQGRATSRYRTALLEFDDFVLRGTIPERLRDSN